MPYRYQLTQKNQHGDNGWWKKTGDTIGHYFSKKLPLCGTNKFHSPNIGVQPKTAYDKRCKRCSAIRRKALKDRMNKGAWLTGKIITNQLMLKSHSPKKPQ